MIALPGLCNRGVVAQRSAGQDQVDAFYVESFREAQ
jgi:hypothetical protein